MTSNISKLPTAAVSYIEVRKRGANWVVELVTPVPGLKPLRTELARSIDQTVAENHATEVGARQQRPVKLGGRP